MQQESEQRATDIVHSKSSSNGAEAIHPWDFLKRLFHHMGLVPWVSFGVIGTGFGVTFLYLYFQSIDFIPADVSSILSASVFVAMLALAFYLLVALSLLAPLWAYRNAGLHGPEVLNTSSPERFSVSGLWALQFVGVGCFLLYVGFGEWRHCRGGEEYFLLPGSLLTVAGLVGWGIHEVRMAGQRADWWKRLHLVAWVSLLGALPFFALWLYLIPSRGTAWLHIGVFFATWLLVVVGSSISLHRIPVWGSALIVVCAMPLLTVSVPILQGTPALLPTRVAEMAGIRSRQLDELRVPRSTCDLIQNALGAAKMKKPLLCDGSEWATVHAQVLSNLGDRWFIELDLARDEAGGGYGALRLTIPATDVQKVRRVAPQSVSCRIWF
jgi:hypothetical protein